MKITIDHQIDEVINEIGMRRKVYSRSVERGVMNRADANKKIAIMEEVLKTLERVKGKVENQTTLFQ